MRPRGFTLIELVITLAIIAIATTMAAPSFSGLIANRRVASATDDLFITLIYARGEAIRLNQTVTVQPINGDWSNGWEIPDPNNAGAFILQHAMTTLAVTGNLGSVRYLSSGRLSPGVAPQFSLCDTKKRAKQRVIRLELSGMPNITSPGACQ